MLINGGSSVSTQALKTILIVILGYSIFKLFSIDDAVVNFIVLGQIPGTNLYLGLFSTLLIGIASLVLVYLWFKQVNAQLIEAKLEYAKADEIKTKDTQLADSKLAQTKAVADILEIEDLDTVSL